MPFIFRTPHFAQLGRTIPIVTALAVATVAAVGAQDVRHLIRDSTGDVVCVVTLPTASSGTPAFDRMAVDIRVPATPEPALLAKLPVARRDYSALPITVFLIPAPRQGERGTVRLPQVTPLAADLMPRPLAAVSSTGTFVRVAYARADLQAGIDVVAERTAMADSGEKLTTQTRCRIAVVDAIVWR